MPLLHAPVSGVTSCSNCKSGCDRSGLVHGLTTALNVLVDKYPNPWDQKVSSARFLSLGGGLEVCVRPHALDSYNCLEILLDTAPVKKAKKRGR